MRLEPSPHLRRLAPFVLGALLVSTLPACKKVIGKLTGGGDAGAGAEGDEASKAEEGTKSVAKGGAGCELPSAMLSADFTVKPGCAVTVERDLTIDKDAILTIGPGARLLFKSGTGIFVRHGGIVAKGTKDEPVVFTSANKIPAKGDWDGIRFDDDVSAGTTFDHAVIEYAGKTGGYSKGAFTFQATSPGGRVTVTNTVFRNNGQRAIENKRDKSTFAKFEGNELKDNDGTSLLLHPDVVGSIGLNTLAEPIRVAAGRVSASATWPKTGQPYFVEGEVSIQGAGTASVLTLPEGATLKFVAGARLDVGEGSGGGLVAKNVTFTSADPSPAPGAWVGLVVFPKASSSNIDGCTIEYAGKGGSYGKGALTLLTKAADVPGFVVKNTTFRNNKDAAFYARGGCGALEEAGSGNRSDGVPLCAPQK